METVIKPKWMQWAGHAFRAEDMFDLIALMVFCGLEMTTFYWMPFCAPSCFIVPSVLDGTSNKRRTS
jgi:hypothetical protein